jgi:hypothetical protein
MSRESHQLYEVGSISIMRNPPLDELQQSTLKWAGTFRNTSP